MVLIILLVKDLYIFKYEAYNIFKITELYINTHINFTVIFNW